MIKGDNKMSIVEQFVDKYYVERRNTNSLKWDAWKNVLAIKIY